MFCPQCGQQQTTGAIRFCSRCGFPLDGVIQLLGTGGMIPVYHRNPDEPEVISPRRKGVKQGGILLLSGAVVVPLFGVMASFGHSAFLEILTAFAAIICFIGGPLRMLYAALFEEGAPRPIGPYGPPMQRPQFGPPMQHQALPPPPVRTTGRRTGGRDRTPPSCQPHQQRYRKHHAIIGERRSHER
jgi:hypothetical protein